MNITNSSLHYIIIKHIIDHGYAPDVPQLTDIFNVSELKVISALQQLEDYHGVVLHPNTPDIWVIHPFSLAPTSFFVSTNEKSWWGNCAWCSLGVAALVSGDVTISALLGGEREQVHIQIVDGKIKNDEYVVHFPIPMKNAWDNVLYTCSNMLIFRSESEVDQWSRLHNIARGDVQPISKIWHFAQDWYGNHLNPRWKKWTMEEASEIFAKHNLNGPIWELGGQKGRF